MSVRSRFKQDYKVAKLIEKQIFIHLSFAKNEKLSENKEQNSN